MNQDFDLAHHRQVAKQAASGQATAAEVAASQAVLLNEVIRLTGALPVNTGNLVPAEEFGALITALSKAPSNATLYVETGGQRALAGTVGSYRGYNDHLRVSIGSGKPHTVSELLKRLRKIKRTGFDGDGGVHYNAPANTPVWIAEMDNTSNWLLGGIRIEDAEVILVGRETSGW